MCTHDLILYFKFLSDLDVDGVLIGDFHRADPCI